MLSRWLWWRPPCLLRRVVVNLQSDRSNAIRGVLWGYRGAWLTLRDATFLMPDGSVAGIKGEIVIHRSNVAFLQVIPTDAEALPLKALS